MSATGPKNSKPEVEVSLRVVTAQALSDLKKKPNTFVHDCNGAAIFAEGHVPGAKVLAFDAISQTTLPKDKAATLVFYYYNKQCGASPAAARAALALGYNSVFYMAEGIVGWKQAGFAMEKLVEFAAQSSQSTAAYRAHLGPVNMSKWPLVVMQCASPVRQFEVAEASHSVATREVFVPVSLGPEKGAKQLTAVETRCSGGLRQAVAR